MQDGERLITSDILGHFGDANQRFFHGPGILNTDFGMSKRIPITESIAVEFRGEFFNIFNQTQFNGPNGNFSSSLFGVVTGASDPRIGQVSAKFTGSSRGGLACDAHGHAVARAAGTKPSPASAISIGLLCR